MAEKSKIRTFVVMRTEDVSGMSGTGLIAEGALFSNGKVFVNWISMHKIVEMADSVAEWLAVHSHEGRTTIVWDDQPTDGPEPEKKKTVLDED